MRKKGSQVCPDLDPKTIKNDEKRCTKNKIANQPITVAVSVNPVIKKGRDWQFSFWY